MKPGPLGEIPRKKPVYCAQSIKALGLSQHAAMGWKMGKKNCVICLLSLLLSRVFTLFACQKSESKEKTLVFEAYKKVLQNKVDFFSPKDQKNIYLKDLLKFGGSGYDAELEVLMLV